MKSGHCEGHIIRSYFHLQTRAVQNYYLDLSWSQAAVFTYETANRIFPNNTIAQQGIAFTIKSYRKTIVNIFGFVLCYQFIIPLSKHCDVNI